MKPKYRDTLTLTEYVTDTVLLVSALLYWQSEAFLADIVTFLIIAEGIILFRSTFSLKSDQPSHVLCTVFMMLVSEDGNAPIADPAVPEGTQ